MAENMPENNIWSLFKQLDWTCFITVNGYCIKRIFLGEKKQGVEVCMWVSMAGKAERNSSALRYQRAPWINVLAPVQCPDSSDTWHWFVHLWTEVLRIKRRESGNASFSLPKEVLKLGKEEGTLTNQALARKSVMNQQWLGKPLSLSVSQSTHLLFLTYL